MTLLTGHGHVTMSANRTVRDSIARIKFAWARKIEIGRSSQALYWSQVYGPSSLGQRRPDHGSLTGCLYLRDWSLGLVNSADLSELFQARESRIRDFGSDNLLSIAQEVRLCQRQNE